MYNNFVPPGIARMVEGKPSDFFVVARTALLPSDLYWAYKLYQLECKKGNQIHCSGFYEREERLEIILRARRVMAMCVLIALVYPNASWNEPTEERVNAANPVRK